MTIFNLNFDTYCNILTIYLTFRCVTTLLIVVCTYVLLSIYQIQIKYSYYAVCAIYSTHPYSFIHIHTLNNLPTYNVQISFFFCKKMFLATCCYSTYAQICPSFLNILRKETVIELNLKYIDTTASYLVAVLLII